MAKQIERIMKLYNHLKTGAFTKSQLLDFLGKEKGFDRQLGRELNDIEAFCLKEDEQLVITNTRPKTYRIVVDNAYPELTKEELQTYQLQYLTTPAFIISHKKDSLEKTRKYLSLIINKNIETAADDTTFCNTHFGEADYDSAFSKKLNEFIRAAKERKKMRIKTQNYDATSTPNNLKLPMLFFPLRILYHRGRFYAGGLTDGKQYLMLDIFHLEDFVVLQSKFSEKWIGEFEREKEKRFGITENINDKVYDIKLEFTSATGHFVKHTFWDQLNSSISFRPLENNNWEMSFKCGINRELVGWIFMWMSNVKILAPNVLIDLFLKEAAEITAVYESGTRLTYHNNFRQSSNKKSKKRK